MKRAAEKRTSMMMNIVIIIAVVFLVVNTWRIRYRTDGLLGFCTAKIGYLREVSKYFVGNMVGIWRQLGRRATKGRRDLGNCRLDHVVNPFGPR